jgi:hypothetical protein
MVRWVFLALGSRSTDSVVLLRRFLSTKKTQKIALHNFLANFPTFGLRKRDFGWICGIGAAREGVPEGFAQSLLTSLWVPLNWGGKFKEEMTQVVVSDDQHHQRGNSFIGRGRWDEMGHRGETLRELQENVF